MRTRAWWTAVCLVAAAVACGDQPTEVVPEREPAVAPGTIALATSSSGDGRVITTDKDDYAPGDTVFFTGIGWPADDTLDILLEDEPATHPPHAWWIPVGADGTFLDSTYVVDVGDVGVTFTLTATSRSTGLALSVVFTDAVVLRSTASFTPAQPVIGASFDVQVTADFTGTGGTWKGTEWWIDSGSKTCANTTDFGITQTPPTQAVRSVTLAGLPTPGSTGAHALHVQLYSSDGCTPSSGVGNTKVGGEREYPFTVTGGSNAPPTADAGTYGEQNEGSSFALSGAGSTDSDGTISGYQWSIVSFDNPDGGTCSFDGGTSTGVSPEIACDDNGSLTVKLVVTDDDGATDDDEAVITVNNVAPTANANASGSAYAGNEGDEISLTGGVTDPGSNDTHDYTWGWEPGAGVDAGANCTITGGASLTPKITCTDDGTFKVTLIATDDDAAASPKAEATLTLANVAPTVVVSPSSKTINEGGTASFTATVTDPGANDLPSGNSAFTFAWTTTVGACSLSGTATVAGATFACTDNGSGQVKLTVDDGDNDGEASGTANLTVQNLPPTVTGLTLPLDPVKVGTVVNLSATFTDPGTGDTHTAQIDWDDASTSAGAVTESNGSGSVAGSHTYLAAGIYAVQLTVTDDDNASDSETFQYVVVYDPDAGFVTGGGWIHSPVGACRLASCTYDTEGKANFGFVSKYQKGATAPAGNTEFQFHAGNLNFSSTSYQWLVVQGTNKATYKGDGKLNGAGAYKFLIYAYDGGTTGDKFRIKIWTESVVAGETVEDVVYDNQIGQPIDSGAATLISGGSIVIQVKK